MNCGMRCDEMVLMDKYTESVYTLASEMETELISSIEVRLNITYTVVGFFPHSLEFGFFYPTHFRTKAMSLGVLT